MGPETAVENRVKKRTGLFSENRVRRKKFRPFFDPCENLGSRLAGLAPPWRSPVGPLAGPEIGLENPKIGQGAPIDHCLGPGCDKCPPKLRRVNRLRGKKNGLWALKGDLCFRAFVFPFYPVFLGFFPPENHEISRFSQDPPPGPRDHFGPPESPSGLI